jgi:hypothetical protein
LSGDSNEKRISRGTYASSAAITDGQHVYAFFDSFGLYAYDMDGKLLWEKDLGDRKMRQEFGEGQTRPARQPYRRAVGSSTDQRMKSSRRTRWTTGSMRPQRSWTTSYVCAGSSICIRSDRGERRV